MKSSGLLTVLVVLVAGAFFIKSKKSGTPSLSKPAVKSNSALTGAARSPNVVKKLLNPMPRLGNTPTLGNKTPVTLSPIIPQKPSQPSLTNGSGRKII